MNDVSFAGIASGGRGGVDLGLDKPSGLDDLNLAPPGTAGGEKTVQLASRSW
jgi:hypothetical protein